MGSILKFSSDLVYLLFILIILSLYDISKSSLLAFQLQTIVTQINHAIGAEGIGSLKCKNVVSKFGDLIWEYLISGVGYSHFFLFNLKWMEKYFLNYIFFWLQSQPEKVCVDIGLCLFNGSHYIR